MPTHASSASEEPHLESALISQTSITCPLPTPPPESHGSNNLIDGIIPIHDGSSSDDEVSNRPVSDNTAVGMSYAQEESLYMSPPIADEKMHTESTEDKMEVDAAVSGADDLVEDPNNKAGEQSLFNQTPEFYIAAEADDQWSVQQGQRTQSSTTPDHSSTKVSSPGLETPLEDRKRGFCGTSSSPGIPAIDRQLDWSGDTEPCTFSRKRLRPQYPSATFQPYSVFKGTQQSDRQIYNVEVTILTVDIEQASMSGYLQICGLTPDHPTLTTFFTGEIIGGPDQKYSFRTGDSSWGASDKTDLTHWARFPAWRPLSLHAKRNINFVYPMNNEDWWQQEHIFMRWKEHFLVPDYKLKSIQGASFEGFYYICFNQIEGRVSGIYFHSKSEK